MHVSKTKTNTSYSLYTYTVRYLKHHSLIEIEALICKTKNKLKNVVELDQNLKTTLEAYLINIYRKLL